MTEKQRVEGPMLSPIEWYQFKLFISNTAGIDMDTIHVIVGVLLQFAVGLIFRIPVVRWTPWLVVLAVELLNEWSDLRFDMWPNRGAQYAGGAKDILLTMLLPTMIIVIGKLRPELWVERSAAGCAPRLSGRLG